jgi:hypothetical protein
VTDEFHYYQTVVCELYRLKTQGELGMIDEISTGQLWEDYQGLKIVWSSGAKAPEKKCISSREVRCVDLFAEPDKKLIFQ